MNDSPKWTKIVVFLAGIYNITWGTWIVLFPKFLYDFSNMVLPTYIWIWQGVGMMIAVYRRGVNDDGSIK